MNTQNSNNVYYFTSIKDLNDFSILLKSIFNIKLSSAEKTLAIAFDFSSYNELLDYMKEHNRIGVNNCNFITKVKKHLLNQHKIEISQVQEEIFKKTISLSELFNKVRFIDFYRFALIKADQNIPMHSLLDQEVDYGVKLPDYWEKDNLGAGLLDYLLADNISDEFKADIKKLLKYSRSQTKFNGVCNYSNNSGGRFELSKILKEFKELVIETSNPNPVFYYCTLSGMISDYGFPFSTTVKIDNKAMKIENGDTILIGRVAASLDELIKHNHDDGKEVIYKYPFKKLFYWNDKPEHEIYLNIESNSGVEYNKQSEDILDNSEGCYITLHKNTIETSNISVVEWDIHEDYTDFNQIKIGAVPIISLGKPLTKNQIKIIQKGFLEEYDVFFSELFNMDKIDIGYEGSDTIALKTGEIIGKILRKHPNSTIDFSDMRSETYTTINEKEMKNPYGFDGTGMSSRFLGYEETTYKEDSLYYAFKCIAIGAGKVLNTEISILDTYTDNLQKYKSFGVDEDGNGVYFKEEEWDVPLFEVDEESLKYFEHDAGFENQLPFGECYNVYIITQDNGSIDDRYFIAGFKKDGTCIINGVYTPFMVNDYHRDDWLRIYKTYKDINNKISGNLRQYDLEMICGEEFRYDGQSEGLMDLNEADFIKEYFSLDLERESVEVTISIKRQNKSNITCLKEIEDILEQSRGIRLDRRKDIKEIKTENRFSELCGHDNKGEAVKLMTVEAVKYFHHIKSTGITHIFSAQSSLINYKEHLTTKQKHPLEIGNKKYMLYIEVKKD